MPECRNAEDKKKIQVGRKSPSANHGRHRRAQLTHHAKSNPDWFAAIIASSLGPRLYVGVREMQRLEKVGRKAKQLGRGRALALRHCSSNYRVRLTLHLQGESAIRATDVLHVWNLPLALSAICAITIDLGTNNHFMSWM